MCTLISHTFCPLSHATDFIDMVNLLMKHGALVDAPDHNGTTPLHLACQQGKQAAVVGGHAYVQCQLYGANLSQCADFSNFCILIQCSPLK